MYFKLQCAPSVSFITGDILDIQVERTWEFEPSNPIRSIVIPYLMCAPAMYIIKYVLLVLINCFCAHLFLMLATTRKCTSVFFCS